MTIKVGTEEDHALLLASIMRTIKFEDKDEFNKHAVEQKKLTVTKKDKDKELLTVQIEKGGGDDKEEEKEKTEGEGGGEG